MAMALVVKPKVGCRFDLVALGEIMLRLDPGDGASYIRALKAPLPQIPLLPTGGVSLATVSDFIQAGSTAVGVGADLVDVAKIRDGDPGAVTNKARQYVTAVTQARALRKS
jgi:2-keto-3-deoxy-6-phosphogluconate aldolase